MVSLIPLPLMSGIVLFAIVTGIGAVALVFGGPRDPPPMASINNPFRNVDFSNLPPISHFPARDGASLAFRYYPGNDSEARGSIVLVHGSSAGSSSMHGMASAFAAAGYPAYALDIRGHGESGTHGKIAYIGQLRGRSGRFPALGQSGASRHPGRFLFGRRICAAFCG